MPSEDRRFLLFTLNTSLYALDLRHVAEIGDPPQLWPIPLMPACYCGALNFHGDVAAVVDLRMLLDLDASCRPAKIIVLHQETASLAFLVDTVIRIVPEIEITPGATSDGGCASTTFCISNREVIQLDLDTLIKKAEGAMLKNGKTSR